jgi:hypothetical protein
MPTTHIAPGSRALACLLVLAAQLAFSTIARADADDAANSAAVDKVTKMNKKAVEEYENLNFEEARKILKDALDLCGQSGLDKHPIKARTHVHLGVVILAGFKQRDLAIKQFKKALEIQPDIKLTKSLANPEVQEAFDEAVAQAAKPDVAEGGGDSKPPPPEKPVSVEPLKHQPITQGTQGKALSLQAAVDASAGAKRVVLNFKPDGAQEFTERDMTELAPGTWSGSIPATATGGNRVAYYIEVQGDNEQVLATKGTEDAPLMVNLKGAGAPETPEKPGDDKDEGPHWFLGLGLGSGIGWTTGNGEVNVSNKISPPGFAPAQLGHLLPEIGYFFGPRWLLSLQLRLQLVTGPTEEPDKADLMCGSDHVCSPAKYALAVLGKVAYLMGSSDFHPFVSLAAGGGYIRHVATFTSTGKVCGADGTQTCVDTVAAGPVLIGPGVGFLYNLTDAFALSLGASTFLGFPTFTFHIDFNAGVAVEF